MRRSIVLLVLAGIAVVLCGLLLRDERSGSVRSIPTESEREDSDTAALATSAPPVDGPVARPARAAVGELRTELTKELPRVRGKVLVEDGGPLGEAVALQVDLYTGLFSEPAAELVPVAADGAFDFPVPVRTTHVTLELRAHELFTPVEVRAVPGEEASVVARRRSQATRTRAGWTLAGRVLDEEGLPFAGARISVMTLPRRLLEGRHGQVDDTIGSVQAETRSSKEGRFELAGLEHLYVRVRATSDEAVGSADLDVGAENGDVRDLVLTLARGGCLRGLVRWQDGTPARNFRCEARSKSSGRSASFTNGTFELCGLTPDQEWSVHVSAQEDGRSGAGEIVGLRTGSFPVDIVLVEHGPPFALEVRVQDEQGAPVAGFHVWAYTSDGRRQNMGAGSSAEGRVVIPGFTAGPWVLTVSAPGFESARRSVDLAPGSPPLSFVLRHSALIRGIVRGTDGMPVVCATVEAFRKLQGTGVHWRMSGGSCDDQGRFELEVPSGRGQILAYGVEGSTSAALEYEIAPGQTLDGFVLTLD